MIVSRINRSHQENERNFSDRKILSVFLLLNFHALLKVIILDGRFSRFLNCTNGIKSRNASYIQTNIYNIFDTKGLKFLTSLGLGLSHLNEQRFRLYFQDCLNPLRSSSLQIKNISYYLLHCHQFSHHRVVLMHSVKSICDNFDSMSDNVKEDLLLYRDSRFDENKNKVILKETINYIKNAERFSGSLFD